MIYYYAPVLLHLVVNVNLLIALLTAGKKINYLTVCDVKSYITLTITFAN